MKSTVTGTSYKYKNIDQLCGTFIIIYFLFIYLHIQFIIYFRYLQQLEILTCINDKMSKN